MNKKRYLFNLLEGAPAEDSQMDFYDIIMMIVIMISLLPLMLRQENFFLNVLDYCTVAVFTIDYLLRWWTAELKLGKGKTSFLLYPFTPMAIVDLLSILPVFTLLFSSFKLLRYFKLFRLCRAFKLFRYFKSCILIRNAIHSQRHALVSAYVFALFYLFISALLVFNCEPQTFTNFWDALYWAAVSLTTVGYGDIYPVSGIGRLVTVVSSFVGIAIVALPSGIITAGYMAELEKSHKKQEDSKH